MRAVCAGGYRLNPPPDHCIPAKSPECPVRPPRTRSPRQLPGQHEWPGRTGRGHPHHDLFPAKTWVLQRRPRQCGLAGPVEATRTLLIQPDGFLGGRIRRAYPAGEQTFELAFKTACETFRRRTTRRKWHWDQPPTRATC